MNIAGLDKADVLVALFNAARPGFLMFDCERMTKEKAEKLLKEKNYFNVLNGKDLHLNLEKEEVDTYRYNYYNGENVAEKTIEKLRLPVQTYP